MDPSKASSNRSKLFNCIGKGLLVIGLMYLMLILCYYAYTGLIYHLDIDKTVTAICGPSALCATLASIFFLIDNLNMQRQDLENQQESLKQQLEEIGLQRQEIKLSIDESKESNKQFQAQTQLMIEQQADTSFYNLLSHTTYLFNSLKSDGGTIDKIIENFLNHSDRYYRSINVFHNFSSINDTKLRPVNMLREGNPGLHKVKSHFESFKQIIDFVDKEFSSNPEKLKFYQNILYNSLTSNEKKLLGILIDYNFIKITSSYNYSDEYQKEQRLYKPFDPDFPLISMEIPIHSIPSSFFSFTNYELFLYIDLVNSHHQFCKIKKWTYCIALENSKQVKNEIYLGEELQDSSKYLKLNLKSLVDPLEKIIPTKKYAFKDDPNIKIIPLDIFNIVIELEIWYNSTQYMVYQTFDMIVSLDKRNNCYLYNLKASDKTDLIATCFKAIIQ